MLTDEERGNGIRSGVLRITEAKILELLRLPPEEISLKKVNRLADIVKKLELNWRRDGEGLPAVPVWMSVEQLEELGRKFATARTGRSGNGNGNGSGGGEAAH